MNVEHPEVLSFLFLLIPVTGIFFFGYFQGYKHIRNVVGRWQLQRFESVYQVKYVASTFFFLLALLFLIFSFAGTYWGTETQKDERVGMEITFVVDISNSMFAEDINPNRLERATSIIRALVRNMPDAWFSVVVFKGAAIKLLPMTQDFVSLERVLAILHPHILTVPGTNIEEGVRIAMDSFSSQLNKLSTIVLFTDGEELTGNVESAAIHAFDQGIAIIPVAVGTEKGDTIPIMNQEVIRNRDGKPVISKLHLSVLEQLAQKTGGMVFNASEAGSVTLILENIEKISRRQQVEGIRSTRVLRYQFFAFLSFCCLMLYIFIRIIKWQDIL